MISRSGNVDHHWATWRSHTVGGPLHALSIPAFNSLIFV
jgi:hypothetical protein